jgi:hypothetical protein
MKEAKIKEEDEKELKKQKADDEADKKEVETKKKLEDENDKKAADGELEKLRR